MDDVEVEDVMDDGSPVLGEKTPLRNQDLSSVAVVVGEFVSQYGWHLLVVTFVVYLFIQYLKKRQSSQSYHSSPVSETPQEAAFVARRQEAMEASRRKMQEELDAKAAVFRERQKQREEEKRRQKIENYKGIVSQSPEDAAASSAALKPKTDKKPFRSSDYNPLSGQGGGTCSWRPGRRGPSSGG